MSAHCDCIAGIGEVCSHVGAILYHLTSLNHQQLLLSQPSGTLNLATTTIAVTDVEQRWGRPNKTVHGNLQLPLEDIDFGYTRDSSDDAYGNVPMLWQHDIRAKMIDLQNNNVKCVAMQAFCNDAYECYKCEEKIVDSFYEGHGLILSTLYDEKNREKCIEELRFQALSFYSSMQENINTEARQKVEADTRSQSKCELWKLLRVGRVTASILKNVLSTKIEHPSISLLKKKQFVTLMKHTFPLRPHAMAKEWKKLH